MFIVTLSHYLVIITIMDERPTIVGESPALLDLLDQASRLAALDRPVLLIGERGTGKELIAHRLHYLGPRWDQPFISLNCAALPETLIDAELFGVERGAFTGAERRRPGRFERAHGGTLFLDEVASLSAAAQEKLLRAIEYGTIERLGGEGEIRIDVRVVAAANVDLPALARAGRFRADLLDRLAFDVLTLPPLRARREDILPLARHFATQMAKSLGWSRFPGFAPTVEAELLAHPWPGNVRELKNVVERAVYRWGREDTPIAEVIFDPFASPWRPADPPAGDDEAAPHRAVQEKRSGSPSPIALPCALKTEIARIEREAVLAALEQARYHQRHAARLLGLSYEQLRHLLRKHGLAGRGGTGSPAKGAKGKVEA